MHRHRHVDDDIGPVPSCLESIAANPGSVAPKEVGHQLSRKGQFPRPTPKFNEQRKGREGLYAGKVREWSDGLVLVRDPVQCPRYASLWIHGAFDALA